MKIRIILMSLLAANLQAGTTTLNLLKNIGAWSVLNRPQGQVEVQVAPDNAVLLGNDSDELLSFGLADDLDINGPMMSFNFEFTSVPLKSSSAGIEIDSIRDEGGNPFQIMIHPIDEYMVINGVKKAYTPLVEDPYRFGLIIKFSEKAASIYLGAQLISEVPFASRGFGGLSVHVIHGQIKLNELYCSGMSETGSFADMSVSVPKEPLSIPSPWISYFGTHCATSPAGAHESFSICRHYGGLWMGISPDEAKRGGTSGETHVGSFTGKPVKLCIEDFRSQRPANANRNRSAVDIIPEAISNQIDIVYTIKTIVPPEAGAFNKDLLYWTVRLIHERFPAAKDRIYWQLGNELMGGHFDPLHNMEKKPVPPYKSPDGKIRGYDIGWKVDYYVNDYFAPAVESIRRASQDVYGDPDAIHMLIGSLNPYNEENLEFMDLLLNSAITGRQAPSLDGKRVVDVCGNLTVHYMFENAERRETMNELAKKYLATGGLKKIWVTEEHGNRGEGPVSMLRSISLFMDWVAAYHLSSDQTKMIWYGDGQPRPGGDIKEWMAKLTGFFGDRPMSFFKETTADATFYFFKEQDRLCVLVIPKEAHSVSIGKLAIRYPATIGKTVQVNAVQFSPVVAPKKISVRSDIKDDRLEVTVNHDIEDPFLLLCDFE